MATSLVIACGAIAHEITAVLRASAWQQVDVQCLPAHWHNTPERIAPAIARKLEENDSRYERILIAYGDCGTGGHLDAVIAAHHGTARVERLPGDHCYAFFAGLDVFESLADEELGTFYLTDYLARNFERLILADLGITAHPELRDLYFQHYRRVVYLTQQPDEALLRAAEAAAAALELPLELRHTGLAPLTRSMHAFPLQPVIR